MKPELPAELVALLDAYAEAVASRAEAGFGMGSGIAAKDEREARAELVAALAVYVKTSIEGLGAILTAAAEGLDGFQGKWLIYTTAHGGGEVYLWWKPAGAGYTTRVEDAGRYTEAEMDEQGFRVMGPALRGKLRDLGSIVGDFAVPAEDVLRHASRVVVLGKLARKGSICPW